MCTQTGVELRPTSFRSNLNSTVPPEIGLVSLLALTDVIDDIWVAELLQHAQSRG